MSQITAELSYDEYTATPTPTHSLNTPDSFNAFTMLKESFNTIYRKGETTTWLLFSLLGSIAGFGVLGASLVFSSSASTANSGSTYSIVGNILTGVAAIVGIYFLIGLSQGYVRGAIHRAPAYTDLYAPKPRTALRGFGATAVLAVLGMLLTVPLLLFGLFVYSAGFYFPTPVVVSAIAILVTIVTLLRIFFAYTIYAIIDSGMRVLDALILSLKIVSRSFIASLLLFIITTILLAAPASAVMWAVRENPNMATPAVVGLWVLAAVITVLVLPVTQASYVRAYRTATHGPLTSDIDPEEDDDAIEETEIAQNSPISGNNDEHVVD